MSGALLCDIWFPGKPRGKGRQNFTIRPRIKNAGVNIGGTKCYPLKALSPMPMPASTAAYEQEFQIEIIRQMRKQGHFTAYDGPIELRFCAFYAPVKSDTKKVAAAKVAGSIARMSTADLDNIEKIICDAANTYVFLDDKQVIASTGYKVYSSHEGIRARFYKADPLDIKVIVDAEFTFQDEEFSLEG